MRINVEASKSCDNFTRFEDRAFWTEKHIGKQGNRTTFCTLLVEELRPQALFTSASAVVVQVSCGLN